MVAEKRRSVPRREKHPSSAYRERLQALVAERDQLMGRVNALMSQPTKDDAAVNTAYVLLTRSWATAGWTARAEILRAAAWFLNVVAATRDLPL